jgi:RNA polymerase sigma-70 factor (ECF subfamily)
VLRAISSDSVLSDSRSSDSVLPRPASLDSVSLDSVSLDSVSLDSVSFDSVSPVSVSPAVPCLLPAPPADDTHRRVHALVNEYMDFVWRSLRRLGVGDSDCDDGCQRVWVVVAQKLPSIEPDKVRSFLFSVVVRVASEIRRNSRRHQHIALDELDIEGARSDAEGQMDQQRVRQLLDQILSGLSWDLRTVFIMYEIEGMSSPEIADALGISRGTAASRLRLAREAFQRSLQRHRIRSATASARAVSLAGKSRVGKSQAGKGARWPA